VSASNSPLLKSILEGGQGRVGVLVAAASLVPKYLLEGTGVWLGGEGLQGLGRAFRLWGSNDVDALEGVLVGPSWGI
jgi:hypothetical protein